MIGEVCYASFRSSRARDEQYRDHSKLNGTYAAVKKEKIADSQSLILEPIYAQHTNPNRFVTPLAQLIFLNPERSMTFTRHQILSFQDRISFAPPLT